MRHVKGFDLNTSTQVPGDPRLLLLRHCYYRDFPLVCDGRAVYSSKALWRNKLAVIIQVIGYEQSRSVTPLQAPWTVQIRSQQEHLDIIHAGSERLPRERNCTFTRKSLHVSFEDSFCLISNMQLILLLVWLTHMLIRCFSSWPISANIFFRYER